MKRFRFFNSTLAGFCATLMVAGPAIAADPTLVASGEKVFKRCIACHTVEPGKNRVGPSLYGVVGRTAGTANEYRYSDAVKAAGEKGLVWSEALIASYIENPKEFLKNYLGEEKIRNKMVFRLSNADQRAAVAAYLGSLASGN